MVIFHGYVCLPEGEPNALDLEKSVFHSDKNWGPRISESIDGSSPDEISTLMFCINSGEAAGQKHEKICMEVLTWGCP